MSDNSVQRLELLEGNGTVKCSVITGILSVIEVSYKRYDAQKTSIILHEFHL